VPAQVRDRANRARLDVQRAALEAEVRRLEVAVAASWFDGAFTSDDEALDEARAKLEALDRVEQVLARGDRQLLLLDTSGRLATAAVAVGDVDTADHVAVFTPGMGTTVEGRLEGYDRDMDQLRSLALRELWTTDPDATVATVSWLGYQAPSTPWEDSSQGRSQWHHLLDPDRSVALDDAAREGAVPLTSFLQGIDAARADDPHLTGLGHSYGSLTTGLALQAPTGVDDAVFFGSPGLGLTDADDVLVPDGHRYVVEARNDPVADLAAFGTDPNQLLDQTGLSAGEGHAPDGRPLSGSTGHSQYLLQDSTSQYNLAVTVAGLTDRQVHDDGRGWGDLLQTPAPWAR
jgi:hypothetical protein